MPESTPAVAFADTNDTAVGLRGSPVGPTPDESARCPGCDAHLLWRETRSLFGVRFDYYEPCRACGTLTCFNHGEANFEVLVPGNA